MIAILENMYPHVIVSPPLLRWNQHQPSRKLLEFPLCELRPPVDSRDEWSPLESGFQEKSPKLRAPRPTRSDQAFENQAELDPEDYSSPSESLPIRFELHRRPARCFAAPKAPADSAAQPDCRLQLEFAPQRHHLSL